MNKPTTPPAAFPRPAGNPPAVPGPPPWSTTFGSVWPDPGVPARSRVLLVCLAIGVFAVLPIVDANPGSG